MKNLILFSTVLLITFCGQKETANITAKEKKEWDYNNQQKWGEIAIECAEGKQQSPININTGNTVPLAHNLTIDYKNIVVNSLTNVGYAINALVAPGQNITYNSNTYELLQFHYHTKAEHTINSKLYPFEIHFVHKDINSDRLAVIGVLFEEGTVNPTIQELLDKNPTSYGKTYKQEFILELNNLIPTNRKFYSYDGSLTTPGCYEIVNWIVMAEPLQMSLEQLQAISALFEGKNNRSTQELHNRVINVS